MGAAKEKKNTVQIISKPWERLRLDAKQWFLHSVLSWQSNSGSWTLCRLAGQGHLTALWGLLFLAKPETTSLRAWHSKYWFHLAPCLLCLCDLVNPKVLQQQWLQQLIRPVLRLSELFLSRVRLLSVGSCPSLHFFLLALPQPPCSQSWKSWSNWQHYQAMCPESKRCSNFSSSSIPEHLDRMPRALAAQALDSTSSATGGEQSRLLSPFSLYLFDLLVTKKV